MKYITIALQVICVLAIIAGILIEFYYGAHIGFVLITAGGLLFGLSEKLDKYRLKSDLRRNKFTNTDDYV